MKKVLETIGASVVLFVCFDLIFLVFGLLQVANGQGVYFNAFWQVQTKWLITILKMIGG